MMYRYLMLRIRARPGKDRELPNTVSESSAYFCIRVVFDELGGPAGNRLSQWPDIKNQGNLYPVYRYQFRNLSDEIILDRMTNSVVYVGSVSYLNQQDHKFSLVDLADESIVPHPVSPQSCLIAGQCLSRSERVVGTIKMFGDPVEYHRSRETIHIPQLLDSILGVFDGIVHSSSPNILRTSA